MKLLSLFALLLCLNDSHGHWFDSTPMVCHTQRGGYSLKVPDPAPRGCHDPQSSGFLPVYQQTRQLYKHNVNQYEFDVILCGCVLQSVIAGNNILGLNRHNRKEIKIVRVTPSECTTMNRDKKVLNVGDMTRSMSHWQTKNKLEWEYPGFGSASETKGWKRHGEPMKLAAQNDVQHCVYTENACSLDSGEAVIWNSKAIEDNQYVAWANITGTAIGKRWLSEDGTRLLTATGTNMTDYDANVYQMSAEGIPFVIIKNGSASEYSALSFEQSLNYQDSVLQSMHHACLKEQFATEQLKAQLISSPIMALRAYTRSPFVTGFCGGAHCKLYMCDPVPLNQLKWLPMPPNRCFANIPLSVIYNGNNETLYLDPVTNILSHSAIEVLCSKDATIPFSSDGILYNYNKQSGTITEITQFDDMRFIVYNRTLIMGPVTFSDSSMHTLKEVIGSDHRNDAMHFVQTNQKVWNDVRRMSRGDRGSKEANEVMTYLSHATNGLYLWHLLGIDHVMNPMAHLGGIGFCLTSVVFLLYVLYRHRRAMIDWMFHLARKAAQI